MDILGPVTVRAARESDVSEIVSLVNSYAAQGIMLYRTPESVQVALHDFVVVVDADDALLACGALKEYSPSLAEVASVAVAREAQGHKLGTLVVRAVERLAQKRGIDELFALTMTPKFFETSGYGVVDRAQYPEKVRRDCLICPRRIQCDEVCVSRMLHEVLAVAA